MAMNVSARYIFEPSQKGESAVGVQILYASWTPNIGIGARYQYCVIDNVRAELMFDYFIKNKGYSMWDINLNAHYVWNIGEHFRLYPLAGVCFASWKDHVLNDTDPRIGLNVGAGLQVRVKENFWLGAEAKLQEMRTYHQGVVNLNATYCF